MAGKIIADQIQSTTAGTLDTKYVVQGSAKFWLSLNGTGTIAVRDSFNTSSVSDQGTGQYEPNFTSSMTNNSWAGEANRSSNGNSNPNYVMYFQELYQSTTQCRIQTMGGTGGTVDSAHVFSLIHGDLA